MRGTPGGTPAGAGIRILIGKVGFDPHDRGILILSQGLRDAGMEVIFLGKFQSAEDVVTAAIQENADIIALSDHCGVLRMIAKDVTDLLAQHGATDICVVAGGFVQEDEKAELEAMGVTGNFGAGSSMEEIVEHLVERVTAQRARTGA